MVLHPIYQQLLEGIYDPLVLSAATKRMLRHPIYQLPLEGGYKPLVLLDSIERMLRHPIYQLQLEGGYDPLEGMQPTLEPPCHHNMFLSDFQIILCLQFCHWFLITSLVSVFYCCYIELDYRDTLLPMQASSFICFISNNIHPIFISLQHQTHPFIKPASSFTLF